MNAEAEKLRTLGRAKMHEADKLFDAANKIEQPHGPNPAGEMDIQKRAYCMRILAAVSEVSGLRVEQIMGRSKAAGVTEPRQLAIYLMRMLSGARQQDIGELMGGRDHASVYYALKNIKDRSDTEERFRMRKVAFINRVYEILDRKQEAAA